MNSELNCIDCGGSNVSQIREVRLPSGHWVLVETLGELYHTREAARMAKRRIIVNRRQIEDEVMGLEACLEEAISRLSPDQFSELYNMIQ